MVGGELVFCCVWCRDRTPFQARHCLEEAGELRRAELDNPDCHALC